jgi:hypothetical protein
LNFEAPARSVARLNVQRQGVQQNSKVQARPAIVMKNWKNTGIISTLIQLFQVKIGGYINKPFATYTPDPFGGLTPSTFTPDPFTGNIHSPVQVAAYNDLEGIKLLNDKLGDIAQQKIYAVDETTGYLVITAWNTSLAAAGVTAINSIAATAIASALAIPFIGPFVAGTIFGLAASADIYIAAKLYATNNANFAALLAATANSNNVLTAHLAADVFNPLQPATPFQ